MPCSRGCVPCNENLTADVHHSECCGGRMCRGFGMESREIVQSMRRKQDMVNFLESLEPLPKAAAKATDDKIRQNKKQVKVEHVPREVSAPKHQHHHHEEGVQ